MRLKRKLSIYSFFLAGLIFIDQLSKYKIRTLGGFYICNHNLAFSLPIGPYIFWIFWTILILFLFLELYKQCFIHNTLYIILLLGGAISNIIDRLHYGCVIDFIDLKFWPVFNLADVYITIGATLIIINILYKNKF